MEKKTIWTNYVDGAVKQKVLQALKDGYAVRIGADCIGHTRAAMIAWQSEQYMEEIGAHEYETDDWGDTYYAL